MDIALTLLTPLLLLAVVMLFAFAGCTTGTAPTIPPADVLFLIDFSADEIVVADVSLTVRWLRSVPLAPSTITSVSTAPTPEITGARPMSASHRWDPGRCRITLINMPLMFPTTCDVSGTLNGLPAGSSRPVPLALPVRTRTFDGFIDPVSVHYVVSRRSDGVFIIR